MLGNIKKKVFIYTGLSFVKDGVNKLVLYLLDETNATGFVELLLATTSVVAQFKFEASIRGCSSCS